MRRMAGIRSLSDKRGQVNKRGKQEGAQTWLIWAILAGRVLIKHLHMSFQKTPH